MFARRLLLRTGDALYRNLSLCQGGPAWESHFRKVDLEPRAHLAMAPALSPSVYRHSRPALECSGRLTTHSEGMSAHAGTQVRIWEAVAEGYRGGAGGARRTSAVAGGSRAALRGGACGPRVLCVGRGIAGRRCARVVLAPGAASHPGGSAGGAKARVASGTPRTEPLRPARPLARAR